MVFPELLATDGQAAGDGCGFVWHLPFVGVIGDTKLSGIIMSTKATGEMKVERFRAELDF